MQNPLFLDIELFSDFFLLGLMNEKGVYKSFSLEELSEAEKYFSRTIVGFNSQNYDLPVLEAALSGASLKELNSLSKSIIEGNKHWAKRDWQHVDLMQVSPGVKVSLKLYAGRMHFPTLHEIEFDSTPSRNEIEKYNLNDLKVTQALYEKVKPQIELRSQMQFKKSMVSRSDAQIAEHIFRELIPDYFVPEVKPGTTYKYNRPANLKAFGDVDVAEFVVSDTGTILLPDCLKKSIVIGGKPYAMGIGGLHSKESNIRLENVTDADVTSFYPAIIINSGLYPEGLGKSFIPHYQKIIKDRVKAKKEGDKVKDATLKIVVNGAFGKLGSKYSCFYSPQLLIQVTVTGQLVLLNLIERLEKAGCEVHSANTDGVVFSGNGAPVIEAFSRETGFNFEFTHYSKYFGRDVNNYFAVKTDGSIKTKGVFSGSSLIKNPDNEIVSEAVILGSEQHIRDCRDITKFLQVRTVNGGCVFDGVYLGKVVRYYHSQTSTSSLQYKKNGNRVPRSENCRPLQDLGQFPEDLDFEWYVEQYRECLNPKSKATTVRKSKKKGE